jgi:hypothetical protein
MLNVLCVERGGYPSIYTRSMAVFLSIFVMEAQDAPSQHEGMPPLEEGVAEARQEGSGRSITEPSRHRLCMASLGLDMNQCPRVLCSI